MTIFSLLSFIAGTVFGIAIVMRSVASVHLRCPSLFAARFKNAPAKLEQRPTDIWFGIASQLVWGSIVACLSLVGALATLDVVKL